MVMFYDVRDMLELPTSRSPRIVITRFVCMTFGKQRDFSKELDRCAVL